MQNGLLPTFKVLPEYMLLCEYRLAYYMDLASHCQLACISLNIAFCPSWQISTSGLSSFDFITLVCNVGFTPTQ